MVGAGDKIFTKALFEQTLTTNKILMGMDDPDGNGKADPALDREWQDEIGKRPSLQDKMQEMMHEKYMQDPERVRRLHEQAGKEMPDSL